MPSAGKIAIIGTGFVADLYMRSLASFPSITVTHAFDINKSRLSAFCNYWNVRAAASLDEFLNTPNGAELILNLTNPRSHFEVTQACLRAGKHVYSEKPLALSMAEARALHALAERNDLLLASAPCNLLSESAQTLWLALRRNEIGRPLLAYAELDDGYLLQAPYKRWFSESGAAWPYADEFRTGCTLEHAAYGLTILMAMLGPVRTVVAASANVTIQNVEGIGESAPDFSVAVLFFQSGVVARVTCSIVASRNHRIQVIGEKGTLDMNDSWNNNAAVRVRRRYTLRRRLIESPIGKRFRISGHTHPKVSRWGAASMNFALGPSEMLEAIDQRRPCRLSSEFALHVNEVTLAIQASREFSGATPMTTSFTSIEPMPWARDQ